MLLCISSLPAHFAGFAGARIRTAQPATAAVLEALAGVDAVKIEGVAIVAPGSCRTFGSALSRADRSEAFAAGLVFVRVVEGLLFDRLATLGVLLLCVDLLVFFGVDRGGSCDGLCFVVVRGVRGVVHLLLQFLHESKRLCGVLALLADGGAVLVEQERHGHTHQSKEGGDGRGPMNSEVVVHLSGKKREGGTEERTQDGVGREHGGCKDGVGVDEVVHHAEEDEHHAETEGYAGENGHDPVDARGVGPGEPEETNGDSNTTNHGGRQTSLRWCKTLVFIAESGVALVVPDAVNDGDNHTDGHTKEGKTANTRAPAAVLLVDDGERTEQHVESSVNDGHVDADEEDDGLLEQQDPGTRERSLEDLAEGGRALVDIATALVDLSSALRELGGTLAKNDRGVGLREEEAANDPEDTGEDGHDTLNPAPANGLTDETTDNWTQNGAHERRGSKQCDGQSTLLGREHVGNDTTSVGKWRGTESTSEESENEESLDVFGTGGTSVESSQGTVGANVEDLTTEKPVNLLVFACQWLLHANLLRHGRPDEWANSEAEHEE